MQYANVLCQHAPDYFVHKRTRTTGVKIGTVKSSRKRLQVLIAVQRSVQTQPGPGFPGAYRPPSNSFTLNTASRKPSGSPRKGVCATPSIWMKSFPRGASSAWKYSSIISVGVL